MRKWGPRALWRGDIPLARAFWIYGVLVGGLSGLALLILILGLTDPPDDDVALLFMIGLTAFLGYLGLTFIGIWRAAGRYVGDQGWAFLAKTFVLIGALNMGALAMTVLLHGPI